MREDINFAETVWLRRSTYNTTRRVTTRLQDDSLGGIPELFEQTVRSWSTQNLTFCTPKSRLKAEQLRQHFNRPLDVCKMHTAGVASLNLRRRLRGAPDTQRRQMTTSAITSTTLTLFISTNNRRRPSV